METDKKQAMQWLATVRSSPPNSVPDLHDPIWDRTCCCTCDYYELEAGICHRDIEASDDPLCWSRTLADCCDRHERLSDNE